MAIGILLEWERENTRPGAGSIGVSVLERARWFPPYREWRFFAHVLHDVDPVLGEAFARECGVPLSELGVPAPNVGTATAASEPVVILPAPAVVRATYDAALYSAAEKADVPARAARAIVRAVVQALDEAGVTMAQAAEHARRPPE